MKLGLLCLLLVSAVYAGPGKIAGTVVDAHGDAIIGASVQIVETSQGASVLNLDGSYVILAVAPGIYTLKVGGLGYGEQQFKEVEVASDRTTSLNAILVEKALQDDEILDVSMKNPPVKLDVSGSKIKRSPPFIITEGGYVVKLPSQYRVEPRHRHYLTQPSGRDVF